MPVFWALILRVASIRLLDISIPSILFWFILLFGYLGYPLLWFGLDPYRSQEVTDQLIILDMFFLSSVAITFLFLGTFMARIILGPLKVRHVFRSQNIIDGSKVNLKLIMLACGLFLVCCFVLYQYISEVGLSNLALLVALDFFPADDLTKLRSDASNGFNNYAWYKLFMSELLLLCTFVFFTLYLCKKTKMRWLLVYSSITISAFSLLMAGEKGQITQLLIGLILVFVIVRHGGYLSIKNLAMLASIALVILAPIFVLFMDSSSLSEASMQVLSRITAGQLQCAYIYLEYIPEYRDFLLGTTFPNPGSIFPYESVTITQEAMAWYNPQEAASGIIGSLPAMFWVESYINFDVWSLPIISLLLGGLLYVINYLFLKIALDPLVISLYVWLILFYKNLAVSFFSDFLINTNLFATIIIFSIFYVICHNGRLRLFRRGQHYDRYLCS